MPRARVQILGGGQGAGRVVGQQRRNFQRHPAVHAVRPVVNRPKQVGGPGDVLERQVEEERLARFALAQLLADRGVVGGAVLDGVVEDRRIRGEPRHRELVDVALERAAIQQVARDVVEPEALAQIVKHLCRFHRVTFASWPTAIGILHQFVDTASRLRSEIQRPRPVRVFRQIAQPFEGRIGQHVFRAAPAPIAVGTARDVHPSLSAQVQQILQWSHRKRSHGRPSQVHQCRRGLAALACSGVSGNSTGFAVGRPAILQTSRESWDCRGCRCTPPCCERSCQGDTGYRNGRRRRTAGPASPAGETGRGAHTRPA